MKLKQIVITVLIAILAVLGVDYSAGGKLGSMPSGEAYNSTTTAAGMVNYNLLKTGQGTFGSVVITGATTGLLRVYDATTTVATARTKAATTTLAVFPASTAAGTYTFDVAFSQGLLIDYASAGYATSTITWR